MKQVTIETVRQRITELGEYASRGGLSLREEFELECLGALAGAMDIENDVHSVINLLSNNEWAEHCTKTALGSQLESEITRLAGGVRPAPVVRDGYALVPVGLTSEMRKAARDCFGIGDIDMEWAALLAAAPQQDVSPVTDNTAQQFESLAASAGSGKP